MTSEDQAVVRRRKWVPLTPVEAGLFLLAAIFFALSSTLQGPGLVLGLLSLLAGWFALLGGERKADRIAWVVIATSVAFLVLLIVVTPTSGTAGA